MTFILGLAKLVLFVFGMACFFFALTAYFMRPWERWTIGALAVAGIVATGMLI